MPTNRRDFLKDVSALAAGGALAAQASGQAADKGNAPAQTPGATATLTTRDASEELFRGEYDVIVVGGGISGTCAAIAAAREGARVALVHERSMLGGNSSSEVRLFPENNDVYHPWIKEGGIHNELIIEERTRNHHPYKEGLMNCHWDLVLYEWVIREKNITLLLNTHMHRAIMRDPAHIGSVYCIQLGTERDLMLSAPLFIDATGDGVLGYRAKADFRWGREARSEYGEALAPAEPTDRIMGNTLFLRAEDAGRPIPFKRPDWAVTFPTEQDLTGRYHGYLTAGHWWIEIGDPMHPIKDNNAICHELLRQLLGVWDHIKNQGKHGADNLALEFVGFWPYKRESRRILGDYVVTQQHVQDPQILEDSVAYGAWGMDIHHPGGILNRHKEPYPSPHTNENWDPYGSQVYGIPLRSLYSRNIENLMMAGRPISCSYHAFASSRVLSTGAIVGQAAGTAAALCTKHGATPRQVAKDHFKQCQQILLRQDCHIPGVVNEDPADLARSAEVTGSSHAVLAWPAANGLAELKFPYAQIFPVSTDRLDAVELLIESRAKNDVELKVNLRRAAHAWDFRARENLAQVSVKVPSKTKDWVRAEFNTAVEPGRLYYIHADKAPGVFWKTSKVTDVESPRNPVAVTGANLPGQRLWRSLTDGRVMCMRVLPEQHPYAPSNVNRGTHRPDMWTNLWISDPAKSLPAWLELRWKEPQKFNTIQLLFDTDLSRRVIQPLFRYPQCVKDYAIEAADGSDWKEVLRVTGNYERRRVHRIDTVSADRIRVQVLATNGVATARIYEVRVYNEA